MNKGNRPLVQMNQLSLKNNRLQLKTSGELPIILEEPMEYTLDFIKSPERSQHVTVWTWKHSDFDWLCPKISQPIETTTCKRGDSIIWCSVLLSLSAAVRHFNCRADSLCAVKLYPVDVTQGSIFLLITVKKRLPNVTANPQGMIKDQRCPSFSKISIQSFM